MRRGRLHRLTRIGHAWAGAVIALVLLALSASGTLLVLEADYLKLTMPEAREVQDTSPEALGAVMAAADIRWGDDLRAVVFAERGRGVHKVYLTDGGAYLSGDGEIVDEWSGRGRFEVWLAGFHHDLTAGRAGVVLSGVVALASVLLVAAGLVAYWPMRRGLRRGLRADSMERQELRSFHRNLGLLAAAPTLILALTGAAMSFPGTAKALLMIGAPDEIAVPEPSLAGGRITDWPLALGRAQAAFRDSELRLVVPARDGVALVRLRRPSEWHPNGRTVVRLNAADGQVLQAIDAEALPAGERAFNSLYPVHAAQTGGRTSDFLALLGGFALTLLTGAGFVSFVQRGLRQARMTPRLPARQNSRIPLLKR